MNRRSNLAYNCLSQRYALTGSEQSGDGGDDGNDDEADPGVLYGRLPSLCLSIAMSVRIHCIPKLYALSSLWVRC